MIGVRNDLTRVELVWLQAQQEHWIRFGHDIGEQIVDRRRRILSFAPGSHFGLVHWASNAFGTVLSRFYVLRAVYPGEAYSTVSGVQPGAEILLRLSGWPKVTQTLKAIDAIEAMGIDPDQVCPDHWRHLHNRLSAAICLRRGTRSGR